MGTPLIAQLESVWDHPVWNSFDWSGGIWPLSGEHMHATYAPNHHPEDVDAFESELQLLQTVHDERDFGEEQCEEQDEETEEGDDESDEEDEEDEDIDYDGVHRDDDRGDDEDDSGYTRNQHGSDGENQLCPPVDQPDEDMAAAFNDFLEHLFQVGLTLCTETFVDGQPDSALLVYLSGIFGLSGDG